MLLPLLCAMPYAISARTIRSSGGRTGSVDVPSHLPRVKPPTRSFRAPTARPDVTYPEHPGRDPRPFSALVASNIRVAAPITIPSTWPALLDRYLASRFAVPGDARRLAGARSSQVRFYRGGWILDLQPRAVAMTLGDAVFVRGGHKLTLPTYAHELAHVAQYRALGASRFLTSYFGLALTTLAGRLREGKPLDVMTAAPVEREAYALGDRVARWMRAERARGAA